MTTFDPASLFDSTTTEVNDTKILPIPEGEYLAVIESAEVKTWASRDGLSSGLRLDVTWLIDDEAAKTATGRDKLTVRQGVMLDLNEAGNGLDMGKGKNVALGRLREATDLNAPVQTKNELGEAYGMKKASAIGKEWNEQAAAFSAYCMGKTADEVKGIAMDETGLAADADLLAGCTVHIGEFMNVVATAAMNAK